MSSADKPFPAYDGDEPYVFVCYAHADSAVVYPVLARLHAAGVRLWYDEGIPPGNNWRAELGERLDGAAALLTFISGNSLASEHCNREINFALDAGVRVVPAQLEDVDLTPELRMGIGHLQMVQRWALSDAAFVAALQRSLSGEPPGKFAEHAGPAPETANTLAGRRRSSLWAGGLAAAMVGVIALVIWLGYRPAELPANPQPPAVGEAPARAAQKSIAVLPFANLSSDPEQVYIADGIAEELLTRLSRNAELLVTSRTSSFVFRERDPDLAAVAAALNVEHILSGTVRRSGDTLRVSAELVDVATGSQLWAETYQRTVEDVFALQDDIAERVTGALQVALLGTASVERAVDPRAYEKFVKARYLLDQFNADSRPVARNLLDEALAIEPDYPLALVERARADVHDWQQDVISRADVIEFSVPRIERALAIDPVNVDALAISAWLAAHIRDDLREASRIYSRALSLDPTHVPLLKLAVNHATMLGRFEAAIEIGEYVIERDPLCSLCYLNLGEALLWGERYEDAVAVHEQVTQVLGTHQTSSSTWAFALVRLGRLDEAEAAFLRSEFGRVFGIPAVLNARGDRQAFHAFMQRNREVLETDAGNLVAIYANAGEIETAFRWLARVEGDDYRMRFAAGPILGDDPRWQAWLESVDRTPEALAAIEFNYVLP